MEKLGLLAKVSFFLVVRLTRNKQVGQAGPWTEAFWHFVSCDSSFPNLAGSWKPTPYLQHAILRGATC